MPCLDQTEQMNGVNGPAGDEDSRKALTPEQEEEIETEELDYPGELGARSRCARDPDDDDDDDDDEDDDFDDDEDDLDDDLDDDEDDDDVL